MKPFRLLPCLLIAALLLAPFNTTAQDKPRRTKQKQAQVSPEEAQALFLARIEKKVMHYRSEMGEQAPRDEQMRGFVRAIANSLVAKGKAAAEIAKSKNKETRARQMKKSLRGIDATELKSLKEILDPSQVKAYQNAKKAIEKKAR